MHDLTELFGIVVVENQAYGETTLQALVHPHECVDAFGVAGENDDSVVAMVLSEGH